MDAGGIKAKISMNLTEEFEYSTFEIIEFKGFSNTIVEYPKITLSVSSGSKEVTFWIVQLSIENESIDPKLNIVLEGAICTLEIMTLVKLKLVDIT